MTFQDHFSSLAAHYRRSRPGYPDELFRYLASRCEQTGLAWDCGTGNGQAAMDLASYFTHVVATDPSADQLSQAQPCANVTYRVAAEEDPMLAPRSVDLITVAQAVHWFHFDRFYAEVRRVSRPGGILAVWTYTQAATTPEVDEIIGHFFQHVVYQYWPPERAYVDGGYRDIPFPFAELTPPALCIREDWDADQMLDYLRSWSAVKYMRQATGTDPVTGIAGPLYRAWGDPPRKRQVTWPLVLRVGRAHAAAGREGRV